VTPGATDLTPAQIAAYFALRAPGLTEVAPGKAQGACPICRARSGFTADTATGAWACAACRDSGPEIVMLAMALNAEILEKAKAEIALLVAMNPASDPPTDRGRANPLGVSQPTERWTHPETRASCDSQMRPREVGAASAMDRAGEAPPSPAIPPPNMGAAALWYAKNGIRVFPLHYPAGGGCSCRKPDCGKHTGKHPLTPKGFLDATTDVAQVEAWWHQWPDANIGMPTGAVTKRIVMDSDPRNGGPEDREGIIRRFGPIPDGAAEVCTGGDGRHTHLGWDGGPVPKTLAPGIDLKGDGGYVVLPPSSHFSGKRYLVDGLNIKVLLNPAPAPDWLKKLISAAPNGVNGRAKAGSAPAGEKWPEGERNNRLTSVAGIMRRRGLSREAIQAALLEENRLRCDPPLPEAEVCAIAASVARYGPEANYHVNGVYGLQPTDEYAHSSGTEATGEASAPANESPHSAGANWPDPLKEEAFYGLAGECVRMVEPHTEADPAALLIQLLVEFGNLIGRGPYYLVEAIRHFCNLFAVIVGQTSKSRKGTSLGQVQALFGQVDSEWCTGRVMGGLSSGEGLIWGVRDEISELVGVQEEGPGPP
jgi:hypothetical protein